MTKRSSSPVGIRTAPVPRSCATALVIGWLEAGQPDRRVLGAPTGPGATSPPPRAPTLRPSITRGPVRPDRPAAVSEGARAQAGRRHWISWSSSRPVAAAPPAAGSRSPPADPAATASASRSQIVGRPRRRPPAARAAPRIRCSSRFLVRELDATDDVQLVTAVPACRRACPRARTTRRRCGSIGHAFPSSTGESGGRSNRRGHATSRSGPGSREHRLEPERQWGGAARDQRLVPAAGPARAPIRPLVPRPATGSGPDGSAQARAPPAQVPRRACSPARPGSCSRRRTRPRRRRDGAGPRPRPGRPSQPIPVDIPLATPRVGVVTDAGGRDRAASSPGHAGTCRGRPAG